MTAITKRIRVFVFGLIVALLGLIDPDRTMKMVIDKAKEL